MAFFLPAIPALAGGAALGAIIQRILVWVLLAKGAAIVARTMGILGIAWFTYEYILEPAINLADTYWAAMPGDLVVWLQAFGVMECASIIVSAYVLWGAKKLFLGKRGI